MSSQRVTFSLFLSLLTVTFLGCSLGATTETPNTQATIGAAVAATDNAQIANQSTIDAAVAATDAAQAADQAALDTAVQATGTAQATQTTSQEEQPTPTVSSDEYANLSEEELAALIDEAVAEAVVATEKSAAAATTATDDDTVTTQEVETIEVTVAGAEEAVALAEELLTLYADLYGTTATEAVAAVEDINQTLLYLADSITALNATLAEIDNSLAQGLEITAETITQLQTAAQLAAQQSAQIQQQTQTWAGIRQSQLDEVISTLPQVDPNQIAHNPTEAFQQAFAFMEMGQIALADGQVSPEEVANLAQQAANAQASLNGQDMAQLAGLVDSVTAQINQGNLPQAQETLGQLGVETVLSFPPSQVAADLPETVQMARNFAEQGRQSIADGQVSAAELVNLAQLGANTSAGLKTHGGAQLQSLTGSVNDITIQLAQGDINRAQEGLNGFDNALGSMSDINKPGLDRDAPSRPSRP